MATSRNAQVGRILDGVRYRLVTIGMYGFALSVAGLYVYAQHRAEIHSAFERLRNCAGCQRRKDAIARMMRQAQEAVGVKEPEGA